MTLRGVKVNLDEFMDDTKTADYAAREAKISGQPLTKAFDKMSMKVYPNKTVQIFVGNKEEIVKMKEGLQENPCFIQGFEVKRKHKEKYLGMVVHREGVRETISTKIKEKG